MVFLALIRSGWGCASRRAHRGCCLRLFAPNGLPGAGAALRDASCWAGGTGRIAAERCTGAVAPVGRERRPAQQKHGQPPRRATRNADPWRTMYQPRQIVDRRVDVGECGKRVEGGRDATVIGGVLTLLDFRCPNWSTVARGWLAGAACAWGRASAGCLLLGLGLGWSEVDEELGIVDVPDAQHAVLAAGGQ